jgi:hypothetical protein
MSDLYALLIGIDYYFPHRLPDGGCYPHLAGCVRDIHHVEDYLLSRVGLQRNHLLKLTASNVGGVQPAEPCEQWPTYENMVARFKQLITMAQPGDRVYIHYSGHGGRTVTAYPQLKGEQGLDEALVPTDIGNTRARYLRDVELYYLIKSMVEKGVQLTVVLDSCHSGGATRGVGRAVARGIASIDTTPRPLDSLVEAPTELAAAWQGVAGSTRSMKSASGWLLEPKGYTLLAACRANESAYEYPFNGIENNGALTYWLLDTLRDADPNLSYKMAYDRIVAKVHGQFEQQTPLLQGEGNVRVFGSERIQPIYTVPVLAVDMDNCRVRINAGEAQGVMKGSRFALYSSGITDFKQTEKRLALVEVQEVGAVDSWATIVEEYGQNAPEVGSQAVLVQVVTVRLQRGVAIVVGDSELRQQIATAIDKQGKGFLAVAGADEPIDFQVALSEDRAAFEVWDAAGVVIPNLRPALWVRSPDAIPCVVQRLVHLAKYRNVQELSVPAAEVQQKLQVELANVADGTGETAVFRPGDKVKLRITNVQPPNPANPNDPARILNVTVLDLASDWSIQQIYPSLAGISEGLQPGATIPLDFEAYLPENCNESRDIVKVFATRDTTQFHWLELPALDQPDTRSKITRSQNRDPLEQMLAIITGELAPTRAIRLTNVPGDRGWATMQMELRVKA